MAMTSARPPKPRPLLLSAWAGAHGAVLLCSVLYVLGSVLPLPLPVGAAGLYAAACVASAIAFGIPLLQQHWPVRFSQEYLVQLTAHENVQYVLMALGLATAKPLLLYLVPLTIFSVLNLADVAYRQVGHVAPAMAERVRAVLKPVLDGKVEAFRIVARMEMFTFFSLIFSVFTGSSMSAPLLYISAVQLRFTLMHMLGPRYTGFMHVHSAAVWGDLRRTFDGLTAHAYCPWPVRWAYEKLRDWMIRTVTPQVPTAQDPGAAQ